MECVKTSASLLNAMDLAADPCEDFFQFACGTWVKKHVIPEDRSSLSTFEVMADDLQIILKGDFYPCAVLNSHLHLSQTCWNRFPTARTTAPH